MAMNPNPKSARFKFAFTGTNSSGKTTMALDVTARMKYNHVLAECVTSQDRKVTWKDDHFPVNPVAHYGMICNTIFAETAAVLKGDADVVFTDRSVLDLFAIALTDHPFAPLVTDGLRAMVNSYLSTYTRIYYLPPLTYQDDGKRPPDEFRMRTHATLRKLIDTGLYPNIVEIPRDEVFKDIQRIMGIETPKQVWAAEHKWQSVANMTGMTLMVKHPARPSSDLDVWLLTDKISLRGEDPIGVVAEYTKIYFGDQINPHLMVGPLSALSDAEEMKKIGQFTIYHPGMRHVANS